VFKIFPVVALTAICACVPIIIPVPVAAPQAPKRAISVQAPVDQAFDQQLAVLRQQAGAGPLAYNAQLARAARGHAADMAARGYFHHVSPEGLGAGQRAQAVGVPACGVGENIAQGQKTSAEALAGWMASAQHRRNMLNPRMASYGLGRSGDTWVLTLYAPC